jgi:ubiquinone/menaquinone biosynthesis C-methylase UbiE
VKPLLDPEQTQVQAFFDSLAGAADAPALRFYPFCADLLVSFLKPRPGTRVLDVATGSGAVAVAFGQAVAPSGGRVTAIDLSPAMLDRAHANVRKMALDNVDLHPMDAQHLEFRRDYFHSVVCSFALPLLPDMQGALREWVRVLRPGGALAFTSFEATAFQPMLEDLERRAQAFGAALPDGACGARRIRSLDHCRELLTDAGLTAVQARAVQAGYHLQDENDWWEVVTGTAMRALLDRLDDDRRDRLRREHLAFVAGLKTDQGLWLDVRTRFASGVKPAREPRRV